MIGCVDQEQIARRTSEYKFVKPIDIG